MQVAIVLSADEGEFAKALAAQQGIEVVVDAVEWSEATHAAIRRAQPEVLLTSEFVPSDDSAVPRGEPNPKVVDHLRRVRDQVPVRVVVLLDGTAHPVGDPIYRALLDLGVTNVVRWTEEHAEVTIEDILHHLKRPRPRSDVLALCGSDAEAAPLSSPSAPTTPQKRRLSPRPSPPADAEDGQRAAAVDGKQEVRENAQEPAASSPLDPRGRLRLSPGVRPLGEVIAVTNAGVSSGATYLALNLAALAAQAGTPVALVDGAASPGVWDLLSLHEMVGSEDGLGALLHSLKGDELRDRLLYRMPDYPHFFVVGRREATPLEALPAHAFQRVRDLLRGMASLIVVDISGALATAFQREALRLADRVLLAASPDIHRFRRVKDALTALVGEFSVDTWELVLTPMVDIIPESPSAYAEALGLRLAGQIPSAPGLALQASSAGVPAVTIPGSAGVSLQRALADMLPPYVETARRQHGVLRRLLQRGAEG